MTQDLSRHLHGSLSSAAILAHISDPVVAMDWGGRVLFWNRAAETLYGRTAEEMLGKPLSTACRWEWERGEDEKAILDICRDSKGSGEAVHVLPDGRRIDIEYQACLLRDDAGNETGVIATLRDVTKRQFIGGVSAEITENMRDRAELRQRAALLDLANDAIFVTDLDGRVTYWNQGAERLYGWTAAEILGKDEREVLKASFPFPYKEVVEKLVREEHWEGEVTRHRRNGEPLIVSSRWSLLRDLHGTPVARLVINTDLTETKVAFDELRRAEAEARARAIELAAILDAIPGATFIAHDPECRTMTSSRAAYDLLRLPHGVNTSKSTREEERSATFRTIKDGRELLPEELPVQRAAATGQPVLNAELTIAFDDGTSRDILGNAVPLRNEAGAIRGAVGSFIDVTAHNFAVRTAREREAAVRTVLDCTTDFIFLKDPQGRYLAINPAAAAVAGKKPEDFVGTDDTAVFPPEVAERYMRQDREVIATGKTATYEDEILYHGELRQIQTVKNVCRDSEGRVVGVVGIGRDITESKQHEKRLATSESRYRSLVEASARIVWTADASGRQQSDSPEWCAFTGQTPEEVAEFGGRAAIHPDDRPHVEEAWNQHLQTGDPFEMEIRIRRHDGEYRTMLTRAVSVRDSAGNIVEWVGMHTDITEQRQAEETLHQSESRLRKLFESDLMGIGIPDRFGAFTEANDELLRITGYTREELNAGQVRWDAMTPPEYRALDAAHIEEAARRGSCTPYEKEYIRKDGRRVPILCGYALLEGSQDLYVGFVQDLTAQKQAEATLHEREQRFNALSENLPQLVWVTDGSGVNIYCNQRYLQYHGVSREDATGGFWADFVHPQDCTQALEKWEHSILTGSAFLTQFRLRRYDGAYRYFLARAVPVEGEAGQIDRWLGISTDIHDQKLVEETMRRTEKLATAGRLAASIAHEINNPLASVTNALYLAMQDHELKPATRQYLKLADQELARVAQVTTQTLRFHKQSTAPALASPAVLMDATLSVFSPRLESLGISVEREYRAEQKLYCFADELRQAFAHIISNSLDATLRGGRLRVRIREARSWKESETRGIRITIADTGTGIPADLRDRIFEAFVSTKEPAGTGLGLWVVEGIIRKHHGYIAVRSTTDVARHGTVLSLFLPFAGASE